MAYLEELIPQTRFDRNDYVRIMRETSPHGTFWRIPLPQERLIKPIGLQETSQVGNHLVQLDDRTILAFPVQTGEIIGVPIVVPGNVNLAPSGIGSLESVENASLVRKFIAASQFENGTLNPDEWDTAFNNKWYQTDEDGYGIAQGPDDSTVRLFPKGTDKLTGDFLIEFGFWLSANQGSDNKSVHLEFYDTAFAFKTQILGNATPKRIDGINGGDIITGNGPAEFKMRVERVSGVIWCYRWTGTEWQREDSWPDVAGASISNSNDLYLEVNSATGVNGFTYMQITGELA